MKKINVISRAGLSTLWVLCLLYQHAQAQTHNAYTGMWEGNFMEQFKTVILLDETEKSCYAGKIIMYSGENRIQDDELSKISIENQVLSFYIAAKESSFKGTFNEANTELSGNFIFPDNSKHPLTARKYNKDSAMVKSIDSPVKESRKLYFPVEELKSDLKDLVNKLKKYHPRLYSYTSEVSFEKQTEEIFSHLNEEISLEQFYLRVAPLVESVACSHTGIRLPQSYQLSIHENGNFFPLNLFIQDQKAWYIPSTGPPCAELAPGCEITSINGKPADQIIQDLLPLIPSQGNCMTTKYQVLNRDFPSYFYLLDHSDDFEIEFQSSGSEGKINLEACSYSEVMPGEDNLMQPYNFRLDKDAGLGVLSISSFGLRDMEAYFAFLDSTFMLINRVSVPHLVLDLRDNQGGHPIFAAQLFSYLTDGEFTYFQRNPDVEEFEPLNHPMQANQNHFNGEIYVLVNGGCQSSTGHLISLLKYHTESLFVGEAPGSSFMCNDFSIQQQLPHTGIELNIPRTTFITDVKGFAEKVPFLVDYRVRIPMEDILQGKDSYLAFVEELIQ